MACIKFFEVIQIVVIIMFFFVLLLVVFFSFFFFFISLCQHTNMAQLNLFVSFVHLCHLFCLAVWVPVLLGKPAGLVAEDALLGPVLREGLPVLCRPVVASGSLFA